MFVNIEFGKCLLILSLVYKCLLILSLVNVCQHFD